MIRTILNKIEVHKEKRRIIKEYFLVLKMNIRALFLKSDIRKLQEISNENLQLLEFASCAADLLSRELICIKYKYSKKIKAPEKNQDPKQN